MLSAILRLPLLKPIFTLLLARRVTIKGWSMYPTLAPGEYVVFDRLAYRLDPPQRGDVVLAVHPKMPQARIMKRVVALPGDAVAMGEGGCVVNGVPWGEDASPAQTSQAQVRTLKDDEYFLLGDASSLSSDTRHFGPARRRDIQARAWLVYWPPHRQRRVGEEQTA